MFKARQQPKAAVEYSSSEEDVAEQIGDEAQMDPKQLEEHMMTMYKPMSISDMKRPQCVYVHMEIVGSPHELEMNPSLAKWQIHQAHHDQFKDNLAIHDRHLAKGDELIGSANRIIPIGLRVYNHQNTYPFSVGLRIPGIMDKYLSKAEKYAWVVGSNQAPPSEPMDIFDPTHIVNKYQYENAMVCSSADLDRDLVHMNKERSKIAVGSFPHARLVEHINNRSFTREEMAAMDVRQILNPGQNQEVEVPRSVGDKLEGEIRPFVEDAAKGMIDATNWVSTFHRADGQKSWNSHRQLVGSIVTGKAVNATKVNADLLHVVGTCVVSAAIFFVTPEK